MNSATSAPIAAAFFVSWMLLCVDSHPQPAIISLLDGMCFRAVSYTATFSASERYVISPFDPSTTYPWIGVLFHFSMLAASALRSNSSDASNGVGIGGKMPAMETFFAIRTSSEMIGYWMDGV